MVNLWHMCKRWHITFWENSSIHQHWATILAAWVAKETERTKIQKKKKRKKRANAPKARFFLILPTVPIWALYQSTIPMMGPQAKLMRQDHQWATDWHFQHTACLPWAGSASETIKSPGGMCEGLLGFSHNCHSHVLLPSTTQALAGMTSKCHYCQPTRCSPLLPHSFLPN